MGRPRVNLEPLRDWLIEEYQKHTPVETILKTLNEDHHIAITRNLFYKRLKEWGVSRHHVFTEHSEAVESRISYLYYEFGLSDKAIYQDLVKSGFKVSMFGVTKLRLGLEIYRRVPIQLATERMQQLREFFSHEKENEGMASRLGRGSLYIHLRQRQFNLSRDAMFRVYREFHDEAIQHRLRLAHRRRGGWTTPGPNYIWSVDGHLKLAQYGFEIYAAIDAHSRYITWFFVGFSGLTARAIFAQFLYIVKEYGFIPQVIRSDRGKETTMMAAAHFMLSQHAKEHRYPRHVRRHVDQPGLDDDAVMIPAPTHVHGPLPWSECWSYGKSTQNQRIESWWNQLQDNRTYFWREYFGMLKHTGLWDRDVQEDRIALLYIYMPIIRNETAQFVRLWNGHRIRKQRNRPHVVSGIPFQLYTMPNPAKGYVDCRAPLHQPTWDSLMELVRLDDINLDEYLPPSTLQICDELSQPYSDKLFSTPGFDQKTPFIHEYELLREALRRYSLSETKPDLTECVKPRGSWDELRRKLSEIGVTLDGLESLGEDEEIDDRE